MALKAANKSLEMVFVSGDQDEQSFMGYHSSMPFLALPFALQKGAGKQLSAMFGVSGIPTLVFFDLISKRVITTEGRVAISRSSFLQDFPYGPVQSNSASAKNVEVDEYGKEASLEARLALEEAKKLAQLESKMVLLLAEEEKLFDEQTKLAAEMSMEDSNNHKEWYREKQEEEEIIDQADKNLAKLEQQAAKEKEEAGVLVKVMQLSKLEERARQAEEEKLFEEQTKLAMSKSAKMNLKPLAVTPRLLEKPANSFPEPPAKSPRLLQPLSPAESPPPYPSQRPKLPPTLLSSNK